MVNNRYSKILLAGLLALSLLARIGPVSTQTIPFSFDHGKDAIAVLHMVKTVSPKLIGPWTSIPGLFFGPAWYYLIAPGLLLANAHPLAPTIVMMLTGLVQVILLYKYFGFSAAIIGATTGSWIMGSTSAWNPYPMSLISLLLLILWQKLQKSPSLPTFFFIGLVTGLGFHFSSAFAVSFIVSVPLIMLIRYRHQLNLKRLSLLMIGFMITFLPQILFEVRHSFMETKAVINYLASPEMRSVHPSEMSPQESLIDYAKVTLIPSIPNQPLPANAVLAVSLILLSLGAWNYIKTKTLPPLLIEGVILLLPSLVIFSFIHFNSWYWYAAVPIITIVGSRLIDQLPRLLRLSYYSLLIIGLILNLNYFYSENRYELAELSSFLPAKLEVLDYVYKTAQNKPFASYQYAPHIYDYDWQYLYFWKALQGNKLPTEFSYKPGEVSYIPEKLELMQKMPVPADNPELIFYIVEKPLVQAYLDSWWNEQQYGEIINQEIISPNITVYVAKPKLED